MIPCSDEEAMNISPTPERYLLTNG
jgi:hypothetical protein